MSRKQSGFTLMEIMMVLVIIGVLVLVSVPRYEDFVGRAQVSDAVVLMASSKPEVELHIVESGQFPDNAVFTELSLLRRGHFTENVEVAIADTCSTAGVIQATMRSEEVSNGVAGRTFVIERDTVGNWRCARGWDNPLADVYLPASCRQDAAVPADPPDCPVFKNNNGHGNNEDGADSSNPGKANKNDASGGVDDEKGRRA